MYSKKLPAHGSSRSFEVPILGFVTTDEGTFTVVTLGACCFFGPARLFLCFFIRPTPPLQPPWLRRYDSLQSSSLHEPSPATDLVDLDRLLSAHSLNFARRDLGKMDSIANHVSRTPSALRSSRHTPYSCLEHLSAGPVLSEIYTAPQGFPAKCGSDKRRRQGGAPPFWAHIVVLLT